MAKEKRHVEIVFSAWNVGELIGTLDRRREQKRLSEAEYSSAIQTFSNETLQMTEHGSLRIMPVTGKLLTASWRIITREHLELFLDIKPEELLGRELSDEELRKLGAKLFRGVDVAKLVAEGRSR